MTATLAKPTSTRDTWAICKAGLFFVALQIATVCAYEPALAETSVEPAQVAAEEQIWIDFQEEIGEAKKVMMADPVGALKFARKAEELVKSLDDSTDKREGLATSLWLESEALLRTNRVAEARRVLDRAIELVVESGEESKLVGDLRLTLARAAQQDGELDVALKNFHQAHDIFALLGDKRSQAKVLLSIGSIYNDARAFNQALEYNARAVDVYPDDLPIELSAANNSGNTLKELKNHEESLVAFNRALEIGRVMDSPMLQGRIMTNIASLQVQSGDLDAADVSADQALLLFEKAGDTDWSSFVWGIKAEIALARGHNDEAVDAISKTFVDVDLATTNASYRDMHEIAYRVYQETGLYGQALSHMRSFKRLDDQGRDVAAKANLALVNAKFDFDRQDTRIALLKAEQSRNEVQFAYMEAGQSVMYLLFAVGGLLLIVIGVYIRDIRRHRDEMKTKNATLGDTVENLHREISVRSTTESRLRRATERANQANQAKTRFLSNMHHELRTPLNAIIGFSEIMEKEIFGEIGQPEYKEYASDIHQSGENLLVSLNDILELTRLDANEVEIEETEIDIGDLARDSLRSFKFNNRYGDRNIEMIEPEENLHVMGDEHLLHRAILVLIENACEFTPECGNISVYINQSRDGSCSLVVEDDGIGIPSDRLQDVIEPFAQVESHYVRQHGGLGLGLSIVRSVIDLHKGRFVIESTEGNGTRAIIRLPLANAIRAVA